MKTTLLAIALCSACYSPSYRDCEVTCASQSCPSGYSCESGFCVSTPGMSCSGVGSDGGTDSGGGDAAAQGVWSTPKPVEFVTGTTLGGDDDPTLTDGELDMFLSHIAGAGGDIFFTRRANLTALWSAPSAAVELNTSLIEDTPELAPNGLTIYFASNRQGGLGGMDIWMAQRNQVTATFATPIPLGPATSGINTPNDDVAPAISRDDLTLVFSSMRNGSFELMIATRTSPTNAFNAAQVMTAISDPAAADENPFLSTNKLTIYFNSNRSGEHQLYQATRASVADPFDPPTPITELNTPNGAEGDPWVSQDGKHIYFTRAMTGAITLMEATR